MLFALDFFILLQNAPDARPDLCEISSWPAVLCVQWGSRCIILTVSTAIGFGARAALVFLSPGPCLRSGGCKRLSQNSNGTWPSAPDEYATPRFPRPHGSGPWLYRLPHAVALGRSAFMEMNVVKVIASSVRKGNVLDLDGKLAVVITAENIHPGKGTPVTHLEMRRIADGVKVTERYRTTDQVERAYLEEKDYNYLYEDDMGYNFMQPESFDQITVSKDV